MNKRARQGSVKVDPDYRRWLGLRRGKGILCFPGQLMRYAVTGKGTLEFLEHVLECNICLSWLVAYRRDHAAPGSYHMPEKKKPEYSFSDGNGG